MLRLLSFMQVVDPLSVKSARLRLGPARHTLDHWLSPLERLVQNSTRS